MSNCLRLRLVAFGVAQLLVLQAAFGLQITTTSLPDATEGSFYAHQISVTNGVAPYQWSLSPGSGPLPTGLSLVAEGGFFDGYVYGTPTVSGTFYFFVRVTDASGAIADRAVTLTIAGDGAPANPVTLSTLHVFDLEEGATPVGELVQGADGALYGACASGRQIDLGFGGLDLVEETGTAFKCTTEGEFTDLIASNSSIIISPDDGLTQGPNGVFYGTSFGVGDLGGMFDLTTNGTLTLLYSFLGSGSPSPSLAISQASRPALGLAGDLLGVTSLGGVSNCGTIYRIDSNGVFATLYSFTGGIDGASPRGALVSDGSGAFYGTTSQGGVSNQGTIFRITANADYKSLYSFTGGSDGGVSASELLYTASGLLYGTTPSGGAGRFGTVFTVDGNGVLTTLYSFAGRSDGGAPVGKLAQGLDGNLYGTTGLGGNPAGGTIFRITPSGLLTTLYGFHGVSFAGIPAQAVQPPSIIIIRPLPGWPFPPPPPVSRGAPSRDIISIFPDFGGNDGANPSGVIQGADGSLYGTTLGGYTNYGTIFRLDLNPAPNVDLAAVSLIAATHSVTASGPYPIVQLIWSVTNQGTSPAPGGWWDKVWVSTNGQFDAHSIFAGAFYDNHTLAPGGGCLLTNNVSLPIAASGTYSLFVQANGYGQIFEANTNNNVAGPVSLSFTLTPPDLVPVSVAALGGATLSATAPNPSITLSWGVTNEGAGIATGQRSDLVWLSTNGLFDSNSVVIGYVSETNDLPAGGVLLETNTFTLPFSNSVNFSLFLQVNAYQSVFESNYSNNVSAAVPVAFTLDAPDLAVVSAIVTPTNIYSSQPEPFVEVIWTVTNQGSGPAAGGWYDWIWLSSGSNFTSVAGIFVGQTLPAGGSYTQTNNVRLLLNAGGEYSIVVEADAYDEVYETNKANNVSAPVPVTFTFTPPDLTILSASAPRQIVSASNITPVTVTWAVTNQGLGNAAGGWEDYVSIVGTSIVLFGGTQLYVEHTTDLPAGGTYSATDTLLLPTGGDSSFTFIVLANVFHLTFESDVSNNASPPLTVNITRVSPPTLIALPNTVLHITGTAGAAYEVDYKPTNSSVWQLLAMVPMTNTTQFLPGSPRANPAWQYRATLINADPPLLDARLDGQGRSLVLFGVPTGNYTLQSAANITGPPAVWQPMLDYTLTNSFLIVTNPTSGGNNSIFYRIVEH